MSAAAEDEREMRRATDKLLQAVAVLTTNVEHLGVQIATLTASMVTQEAHNNLGEKVVSNDRDSRDRDKNLQAGISRNDARWSKLAWFICLTVAAAVLGLVLYTGVSHP